jgi:DNA polymerase III delta prime subunit
MGNLLLMETIPNGLWVEKYRPNKIEDYVWVNENQKHQVESWVREKEIPSMILSGQPGVGKTTLARCLFAELEVNEFDIRYVNASHHTGVDYFRGLQNFIETMPSGRFRYVLLDESDYMSQASQALLRSMIEEYSAVCRWILTCNYPNKIIPALHSRLQGFHIEHLDAGQFISRAATVLVSEGIDINEQNWHILDEYVTACYPDLRKCLNMLQQNCQGGELRRPQGGGGSTADYMVQAVALFRNRQIHEARQLIVKSARPEEYEDIYRLFYRNLDWWSDRTDGQHQAIVIIANRLRDHGLIADPELNLSAALVELSQIG